MTEKELKSLLLSDPDMLTVLTACRDLNLPDCWLAAGAVQNTIWNHLSGRPLFDRETDMDVVFFDPAASKQLALKAQRQLQPSYPAYPLEVKNQADLYPDSNARQTHEEHDDFRKQFFREVLHFLDENFGIISVR